MKCFHCSADIKDGISLCPRCGADQRITEELITRARNHDQAAITELYNKTYSNVYYTIKALVKDEDATLDILQDSYIKAFRSLDQLKEPAKFKAWIKQIAHNRAIDFLRKTKPILFINMESDDGDMPLEFEDTNVDNLPDVVIDRKETSRLIREILNELPDEQRAVISMFYYEQLSVKEIAEQLGVSENTVKSRLNYGRKKIETKVLALEKKGTKLYGLAPIPFLLLLFKAQSTQAASVTSAVSANILSNCTGNTAAASSAAGAVTATKSSAGIFGALKASLAAKIVAGVLSVAVIGGATFGVVQAVKTSSASSQASDSTFEPFDYAPVKEQIISDLKTAVQSEVPDLVLSRNNAEFPISREDIHVDTDNIDVTIYQFRSKKDKSEYRFYAAVDTGAGLSYPEDLAEESGNAHGGWIGTGLYELKGLSVEKDNSVRYESTEMKGDYDDDVLRKLDPLLTDYQMRVVVILDWDKEIF